MHLIPEITVDKSIPGLLLSPGSPGASSLGGICKAEPRSPSLQDESHTSLPAVLTFECDVSVTVSS